MYQYIDMQRPRMVSRSKVAAIVLAYTIAIDCLLFSGATGALTTPIAEDLIGCSSHHFDCMDAPVQCIPHEKVCDGRPDCASGEDESFDVCSKTYTPKRFKRMTVCYNLSAPSRLLTQR